MPVGPSHRRSGGSSRSSSRSGLSRSSSRSSYSSSRSYGSSRRYGSSHYHRHYYGDDDYYGEGITITPRGWAKFGIAIGFLAVVICVSIAISLFLNNVPYHHIMQSDAREYYEIIAKAESGEEGYYTIDIVGINQSGSSTEGGNPTEYSLVADIDGNIHHEFWATAYCEVQKNGVNYYYLNFSFWSEHAGERIYGTTYTYYSEAQICGLSSLSLVYTKNYDNDGSWDFIQSNYSLKDNIDYWYTGKNITIAAVMLPLALGLAALMIWCCVLVHRAGKKAQGNSQETSIPNSSVKTMSGAEARKYFEDSMESFGTNNPSNLGRFKVCIYCGTHTRIDDDSCGSCGSKKFRKAKDSDLA